MLQEFQLMRQTSTANTEIQDFDVIKQIGKGGHARVYLAKIRNVNMQAFAIKVLRKDKLVNSNIVGGALLEKQILQRCQHKFIAEMRYYFASEKRLYYVMDYYSGGSLCSLLKQRERLSDNHAKFYIVQIVDGLKYLHSNNLAHRDMKAANVMIAADGYVKITDFTLAQMIQAGKKVKDMGGTPEYIAPEMLKGKGHDAKIDWWAVGIMIYEMMIGVTPFFNINKNKMLKMIMNEDVQFPNRRRVPHSEAA